MKIDIKFAELHAPLFLAGTNLQMKLDPTKRTGLKLVYDNEEKMLLVTWQNKTSMLPLSTVLSMEPGPPEEVIPIARAPGGAIKAQVSTPQDHVFAGAGQGKTRA